MKIIKKIFYLFCIITGIGLLLLYMPYPYKNTLYADYIFDKSIAAGAWPGGVVVAGNRSGILIQKAFGHHTYHKDIKVKIDDIFDLASLTKVIVTTSVAMELYSLGELDLNEYVFMYKPAFLQKNITGYCDWSYKKSEVTVTDLLSHSSGLGHVSVPRKRYEKKYLIDVLLKQPLVFEPGKKVVYSDLNFVILGAILEMTGCDTLENLFRHYIAQPLEMTDTYFNPPGSLYHRIIPTEYSVHEQGYLTGVVHDNLSYALSGAGGHAGLFSTGKDLAAYCMMVLNSGNYKGKTVIPEGAIEKFKVPVHPEIGSSRCLGWDSPSDMSSGGIYISDNSIGHTGYTGTSLWIDFDNDFFVVLLTNAVHPFARYKKEHKYRFWRNRLHSTVYELAGLNKKNNSLKDNPCFSPWYHTIKDKIEYCYWLLMNYKKMNIPPFGVGGWRDVTEVICTNKR